MIKDNIFPIYEICLPNELIEIVTYYLDEKDLISVYKSGIFPNIIKDEYWINRFKFYYHDLNIHMLKKIVNAFRLFIQKLNMYQRSYSFKDATIEYERTKMCLTDIYWKLI